ncbi:BadF/BadG/BcrA/BcrD ATPase family protein [Primorskyibacter sp. S187A]|uniref:BadF/BadG/BcrA/BcrD ATPase family protein n=1 Tax=Primorskyibacter sp. S187A TaxID=3415130 RepID=UPI003C7A2B16
MGGNTFIGVDGGGTGCRLALVREDARFEVEGGPCNVSTDLAGALRELSAGLDRLAAQAGMDRGAVRALPACLGLAGVVAGDPRPDISDALRLSYARILDDRAIALRGALGSRDGAMVGIGTGSFFAIQQNGRIRLAGGWGLRLGDEASGAWLGREAFAITLASVDGLVPESPLTESLLERYRGAPGLVAQSLKAAPQDYAALAPEIVAASDAGDRNARELLRRGRAYVIETLATLGWEPGMPLCFTGGLADSYTRVLPPDVQDALMPPEAGGLDGALLIASEMVE